MMRRARDLATIGLAALALVAASRRSLAHEASAPWVAGADECAWIVWQDRAVEPDESLPEVRLLFARPSTVLPAGVVWQTLPPLVGRVREAAAAGTDLYLLFERGALTRVRSTGPTPCAELPPDVRLLALAGDSESEGLFAVVDEPGQAPAAAAPTILRMEARGWVAVSRGPADAGAGRRVALAVRGARMLLAWCVGGDADEATGTVFAATGSGTEWNGPRRVGAGGAGGRIWCGWTAAGAAIVTAEPSADGRTALGVYREDGGAWQRCGTVQDGGAPAEWSDQTWGVGFAHGRLLAARRLPDGDVEAGWAELRDPPALHWSGRGLVRRDAPTRLPMLVNFAAMGGLMVLLFFLRPEQLTAAPRLPAELALARPLARLVAGGLDLLPAAVATAYWWMSALAAFVPQSRMPDPAEMQVLQARLWPVMMAMCGLYAAYCLAWEALTGTTPGKHLLGCRVISADGGRATLRQVVIRNLVRVPEASVGFVLVCSLFVMLVASQRRQRIGDVLAGTLVVVPALNGVRSLRRSGGPSHGDRGPKDDA